MRKRTKSRRGIRWPFRAKPTLWFLTIVAGATGVYWSPITSVTTVHVSGATPRSYKEIREALRGLKRVPCIRVNARNFESLVLNETGIDTAELNRTPFGSARLKVTYRKPVARRFNTENIALSSTGVLYEAHELPAGLPVLNLDNGDPGMVFGLGSNLPLRNLVGLISKTQELFPGEQFRIDVKPTGRVCLNIQRTQVDLLTLDDLDAKMQVLADNVKKNPRLLSDYPYLAVTAEGTVSWSMRQGVPAP